MNWVQRGPPTTAKKPLEKIYGPKQETENNGGREREGRLPVSTVQSTY